MEQQHDMIDQLAEIEAAKAAPYETRVHRMLSGKHRKHRCTAVLAPNGELRLIPVHRYNAGPLCGGDVPLRAEPVRFDGAQQPIEWDVKIRPHFASAGWQLYRDFLRTRPDGAKYEKLLDAVIDALALDFDGRPTAKLKMSDEQRKAIIHPEARALAKQYHAGRKLAAMSEIDALLAEVGAPPTDYSVSEEEKERERLRLKKQLSKQVSA